MCGKTSQRLITFCVSRRRRRMLCGHARLCVCLSAAVRPHYCTDPDVTWGHGRDCPLVVHYLADLQSGHGLRCYGNITRTLVTSLRQSRDMQHSANGRLGGVCARHRPATGGRRGAPQNRAPHTGSGRGRAVGDRPPRPATGRRGGVLNITAAVWTAGFHWWRSGNKKRTQNVSEYMLVLSLCLVSFLRPGIMHKRVRPCFSPQCIEG